MKTVARIKPILVFCMHQFLGTWGVAVFAYLLGTSLFDLTTLLGRPQSMRPLHWILTETPFFPVQIVLGLYFGWLLGRRLKHRTMLWVWILPALVLCYAVVGGRTLSSEFTSVLVLTGSPFLHYFGWGCQPKDGCLDQLIFTMPFYAATAYSIGARLALSSVGSRP